MSNFTPGHSYAATGQVTNDNLNEHVADASPTVELVGNLTTGTYTNELQILGIEGTDPADNVVRLDAKTFATLDQNSATGRLALGDGSGVSGTNDTFIGVNAGQGTLSGSTDNVGVGHEAGKTISTGDRNVAVGSSALRTAAVQLENVAVGWEALKQNAANYNTALGSRAAQANTGTNNVAVGRSAMAGTGSGADIDIHYSYLDQDWS